VWRGVENPRPWTEGTDFEGGSHICLSAGREEEWFLCHRLLCVVGSKTCRSGHALPRPFSCVLIRCVGGYGRMQGNGLVEEGLAVLLDSMKIDCSDV